VQSLDFGRRYKAVGILIPKNDAEDSLFFHLSEHNASTFTHFHWAPVQIDFEKVIPTKKILNCRVDCQNVPRRQLTYAQRLVSAR
jgi:hypothetical protein